MAVVTSDGMLKIIRDKIALWERAYDGLIKQIESNAIDNLDTTEGLAAKVREAELWMNCIDKAQSLLCRLEDYVGVEHSEQQRPHIRWPTVLPQCVVA